MNQIEEVVRLRNRVGELEEENRFLREAVTPSDSRFRSLQLTPKEAVILRRLFDASPRWLAYESLIVAASLADTVYAENSIKVYIYRIRKKIDVIGARISSKYGHGYLIEPSSKEKLREVIQREALQ